MREVVAGSARRCQTHIGYPPAVRLYLLALTLLAAACDDDTGSAQLGRDAGPPTDAGITSDGAPVDGAPDIADAAPPDTSPPDAAPPDALPPDAFIEPPTAARYDPSSDAWLATP